MGGRGTRAGMDKAERFGSSDLDIERRRPPGVHGSSARRMAWAFSGAIVSTLLPYMDAAILSPAAARRSKQEALLYHVCLLHCKQQHPRSYASPQVFSPNAREWIWSWVFWFYSLAEDSQWLLARIAQMECSILSYNQVYVHMIAWISCLRVCNDS